MEEASGGRMHYMFNRVGGLKEEVPAGWTGRARAAIGEVRRRHARPGQPDPAQRDLPGPHRRRRACCRPPTPPPTARPGRSPGPAGSTSTCAATSPTWRTASSTCRWSPGPPATATPGSRCCSTRCTCRSTSPSSACDRVDRLTGPVNVRLPKVVKAPEGHTYAWTENPLGINGYYLVSRGREDAVAAEAAHRVVRQRAGAGHAAARLPGARPDRDPRLDVLRGRRHRQVASDICSRVIVLKSTGQRPRPRPRTRSAATGTKAVERPAARATGRRRPPRGAGPWAGPPGHRQGGAAPAGVAAHLSKDARPQRPGPITTDGRGQPGGRADARRTANATHEWAGPRSGAPADERHRRQTPGAPAAARCLAGRG